MKKGQLLPPPYALLLPMPLGGVRAKVQKKAQVFYSCALLQYHTSPCLATPVQTCLATSCLALPRPATSCLPNRIPPYPAAPHQTSPASPCQTLPCQTSPHHTCLAKPALPNHAPPCLAMPNLTCNAMPHPFLPRLAKPEQTCRAKPNLTCPCFAQPCPAKPA